MVEKENYKLLISKEEWKNIAKYLKENETRHDQEEKSYKKNFLLLKIISIFNILVCLILLFLLGQNEDLAFGLMGPVLAALITVDGVFAGFYFNKKQTYKEIVTRERIEWLHKIQGNLALYLDLTSSNKEEREKLEEDYKNTVDKLYYEIIFNINHHKDKKALKALEKYHKEYEIRRKRKSKKYSKDSKKDKLKDKVIEEFVKIFNETWRDIKGEAF